MSESTTADSRTIALCLSGGGLRATLFHLGVVKHLRALEIGGKRAINLVSDIYSVSGGSILAAHMLANWSSYTSPQEDDFAKVEQDLLAFARRNMRDRILRRWFLLGIMGRIVAVAARLPLVRHLVSVRPDLGTRTYWLQQQYDALLKKVCFSQLEAMQDIPTGHILTTSFQTGELCAFSGAQFEIEPHDQATPNAPHRAPCGHMRLSFAVAASSAFPPMFPPIKLTETMLANPRDEAFRNAMLLSDGGVFDNLGIEKFKRDQKRGTVRPTMLIISDAGGSFRAQTGKTYSSILARNVRASDILMHRVADLAKDDIAAIEGEKKETLVRTIRISDTADDPALTRSVQQRLRLVRTDLDRFDGALAGLLVEHGTRLARACLGGLDQTTEPDASINASNAVERIDRLSEKAANRRWWSLFLDWDWTLVPLYSALTITGLLLFSFAQSYSKAKSCEASIKILTEVTRKRAISVMGTGDLPAAASVLSNVPEELQNSVRGCQLPTYMNQTVSKPAPSSDQSIVFKTSQVELNVHDQAVYIQFAGFPRERVTALNKVLRNAGWNTQSTSGERTSIATGLNQVRYSGDNLRAAEELATAINAARGTPGVTKVKPLPIINGNVLEVWISPVPGEGAAIAGPDPSAAFNAKAE